MENTFIGVLFSVSEVLLILLLIVGMHGKKIKVEFRQFPPYFFIVGTVALIANAWMAWWSGPLLTVSFLLAACLYSWHRFKSSRWRISLEVLFIMSLLTSLEFFAAMFYLSAGNRLGNNFPIEVIMLAIVFVLCILIYLSGRLHKLYILVMGYSKVYFIVILFIVANLGLNAWLKSYMFVDLKSAVMLALIFIILFVGAVWVAVLKSQMDEKQLIADAELRLIQRIFKSANEGTGLDYPVIDTGNATLTNIIYRAVLSSDKKPVFFIEKDNYPLNVPPGVASVAVYAFYQAAINLLDEDGLFCVEVTNDADRTSVAFTVQHKQEIDLNTLVALSQKEKDQNLYKAKRLINDVDGEIIMDSIVLSVDNQKINCIYFKIIL